MPSKRFVLTLFFITISCGAQLTAAPPRLVDLAARTQERIPFEPGRVDGLTQEVWYEGEPLHGKPTRVYAWLGRPADRSGTQRLPAMLLVHGGGGRAFQKWAQHWAEHGYVALAMDTSGQGPDGKRHDNAGPDQSDASKFRPFTDAEIPDMWTWHAVGAVLRGHGLLNQLEEVDPGRIGITGISWGGYLTCLTAGIDHSLRVAVPVFGCGFLGDNSFWRDRSLAALDGETRARWLGTFDPSVTMGSTECPILFLNGTHDFAYPPDSYRRTFSLVKPELRTLGIRVNLPHGHIWTYKEVDAFVDHVLRPGPEHPPLARLGGITRDNRQASVPVLPGTPVTAGTLHWTADTGAWQARQWQDTPARLEESSLTAPLPDARPLTFFFTATDRQGLITSSAYAEIDTGDNTACIPRDKLENDFYDWNQRHAAVLGLHGKGNPDVIMLGDSITHLWGGEPQEPHGGRGLDSWQELFGERRVFNLGFGWDRTQNVIWRLEHGELAGLHPKAVVVNIGTNNFAGTTNARANTAAEIAEGIGAIVERVKAQCPGTKIILMAILPRGEKPEDPMRARVAAVNALLPAVAKASGATLLDITARLLEPDGTISRETMPDSLHPGKRCYHIWADALRPLLGDGVSKE